MPRFFFKHVLAAAFSSMPKSLYPEGIHLDYEIIYFEARNVSTNIGVLKNAVRHLESPTLVEVLTYVYKFGKSAKALVKTSYCTRLTSTKTFQPKNLVPALTSGVVILTLRSIAYWLGYHAG
jgi:hypothetical protein